jgi:hypothetical protein
MKSLLHKSKYFQITSLGTQNQHLTFEFLENKDRIDIVKIDRNMTAKEFKIITDYAVSLTLDEMIADLITLRANLNRK